MEHQMHISPFAQPQTALSFGYYAPFPLLFPNFQMDSSLGLCPFIPLPHSEQKLIFDFPQPAPTQLQAGSIEGSQEEKLNIAEEKYEKERDRNMISNSLKVFRKFLKDSSQFESSPIEDIIRIKGLNYSSSAFMEDLEAYIPKDRNYLGAKFLSSLALKKKQDSNFKIAFRTLLNYYYKKVVFSTVLTSSKILGGAKKKQLVGARKIRESCLM